MNTVISNLYFSGLRENLIMEISALTRTVVKRNHAVIAPDGYINSNVPGWTNCTVNVIINEAMGAHLCQTLITAVKIAGW